MAAGSGIADGQSGAGRHYQIGNRAAMHDTDCPCIRADHYIGQRCLHDHASPCHGACRAAGDASAGCYAGSGEYRYSWCRHTLHHDVNGQRSIWPNGQPFVAKGVDIWGQQVIGSDPNALANQITSMFPGVNMVRIAAGDGYGTDSAAALEPFVLAMTA